ncbi:unnamed protein product, partial [Mesorhabditis belari]|uniref:Chitin-binding type-2 domain-containing protein n=1 Tax=Mesorhabditis belari TaxID=2138241 RepID=A0AAF3F5E4_9BILA
MRLLIVFLVFFWETFAELNSSRVHRQAPGWENSNLNNFGEPELLARAQTLISLCRSGRQFVGLGACSRTFLECSPERDRFLFRNCPGDLMVFSGDRCRSTEKVPECFDTQMNTMNEETRQLVEKDQFCTHGGAVYFGRSVLSRQALVCHENLRDLIVAGCPFGTFINTDLQCQPIQKHFGDTSIESFAPIRQFFIKRHCDRVRSPYVHYGQHQQQGQDFYRHDNCATWYIDCNGYPSLIQCGAGEIFEPKSGYCRRWTHQDLCPARGLCVGREWTMFPLVEKCSAQFVRCEGQEARFYQCPSGLFFNGHECARMNDCMACVQGMKREDYAQCNKYSQCVSGKPMQWASMKCKAQRGYNDYMQRCEDGYQCAAQRQCQPGDFYQLNCHMVAVCQKGNYQWFSCPQATRWDAQAKVCVSDANCNRGQETQQCRENDIIETADCQTFSMCERGNFVSYSCRDQKGNLQTPCARCQNPEQQRSNTPIPAQCQQGKFKSDETSCGSYFVCQNGQWIAQRCQNGWFNLSVGSCVQDGRVECGNGHQLVCEHNSFLVPKPNCGRFLVCKHGRWIEMECPKGYIYDESSHNCIAGECDQNNGYAQYQQTSQRTRETYGIPSNVQPKVQELSKVYRQPITGNWQGQGSFGPPAPPPSTDQTNYLCQGNDKIVDPVDCTRFYQCTQYGRYTMMQCPSGSYFDPSFRACVKGENCGKKTNCDNGWYHPMEQCGKYRICYNGEWVEGRCPNYQPFINGQCDATRICTKIDDPFPQRDCQFGSVRPHPQNSRIYWVCELGGWVERSCPANSIFNWKSSQCVYDQPAPPQPPQTWCYQGQTRPIQGQCGAYEICYNGQWQMQTCEYGSGFSNGRCIRGVCQDQIQPGAPCTQISGAANYRLDPQSCDHFYQCAPAGWTLMPCAAGTVWNPVSTVCDWPRNVPQCNGQGYYGAQPPGSSA